MGAPHRRLERVAAGGKLSYDPNLRTQRRGKSALLFVEYRGELVYDAYNPSVFQIWAEAALQKPLGWSRPGPRTTP